MEARALPRDGGGINLQQNAKAPNCGAFDPAKLVVIGRKRNGAARRPPQTDHSALLFGLGWRQKTMKSKALSVPVTMGG